MGKTTAYFLFVAENREETKARLISEGLKGSIGEVGKALGEKWKTFSDEEKQVYKDRSAEQNALAQAESPESKDKVGKETGRPDEEEEEVMLPLTRVKRIMAVDKDVRMVSKDAVRLMAQSTELFLQVMTDGAYLRMKAKKRKTVTAVDVERVIIEDPRNFFIKSLMRPAPKKATDCETNSPTANVEVRQIGKENIKQGESVTKQPKSKPAKASKVVTPASRTITHFFGGKLAETSTSLPVAEE